MRYSTMNYPLAPAHALARKRPRTDDELMDAATLPPLHAYNPLSQHHHQAYTPSLPTLSQVLRPSLQFSVLAPPPSLNQYTPPSQHFQYKQTQSPPASRSATSSPSPAASETSLEDDDDDQDHTEEDKTPWPTANEYYDILTDESRKASIPVYDLGVDPRGVPLQPECIYNEPKSCMYFLKCGQLLGRGSFGFPRKKKTTVTVKNAKGGVESVRRCDSTKEFEWRKMSFVTGLPKKQPLVRYITATCYSKTHRSATEKKKVMRMHAVMLANPDGAGEQGDYVLVHIRAGGSKRVGVRTNSVPSQSPRKMQPAASPSRVEASPMTGSIHSLLSAHDQVMMMANSSGVDRPITPLYTNYAPATNSASPLVKRRRTEMLPSLSHGACPPRSMPLWLTPPPVQH
jgi:hypothetical protein